MEIGDLVRMISTGDIFPGDTEKSELGLVTELEPAYPADPHERDLLVTVLFSDGQGETWYDWQLELLS